jgi:hypothetical protein
MDKNKLKGVVASELIIVAMETKGKRPTQLSFEELIDVVTDVINKTSAYPKVADSHSFKIGDIVYHRSVYEHKEPLKVVGITEDKLFLEGDYSGGTHGVCQRAWLPIKGTSKIYNHAYKLKAREEAIAIETLAIPCAGSQYKTYKAMMNMVDAVLVLTNDVSLNPEYE